MKIDRASVNERIDSAIIVEDRTVPDDQTPERVRMQLDGMDVVIAVNAHATGSDQLVATCDLPFLRLGSRLNLERSGRDGRIQRGTLDWVALEVSDDARMPCIQLGLGLDPLDATVEAKEQDTAPNEQALSGPKEAQTPSPPQASSSSRLTEVAGSAGTDRPGGYGCRGGISHRRMAWRGAAVSCGRHGAGSAPSAADHRHTSPEIAPPTTDGDRAEHRPAWRQEEDSVRKQEQEQDAQSPPSGRQTSQTETHQDEALPGLGPHGDEATSAQKGSAPGAPGATARSRKQIGVGDPEPALTLFLPNLGKRSAGVPRGSVKWRYQHVCG